MSDVRERVGERIRSLREAADLTQEELSFATGMSRTFLSSLERGLKSASVDSLERLAKALRISPGRLIETAPSGRRERPSRLSPEEHFALRVQALARGASERDTKKALEILRVFFAK